jgi:hypothetical protein
VLKGTNRPLDSYVSAAQDELVGTGSELTHQQAEQVVRGVLWAIARHLVKWPTIREPVLALWQAGVVQGEFEPTERGDDLTPEFVAMCVLVDLLKTRV